MSTQTIKKSDLRAIHEVACEGWKKRIEGYAARNVWGDLVELTQAEVDEMFNAADNEKQTKLLNKYFTRSKEITERIKDLSDVLKALGEDDKDVIDYRQLTQTNVSDHIINYQLVVLIAKVLNEGWIADTSNSKYYPYFRLGNFSCVSYDSWNSGADASARLCFKNAKLAQYAGTQFVKVYEKYMK